MLGETKKPRPGRVALAVGTGGGVLDTLINQIMPTASVCKSVLLAVVPPLVAIAGAVVAPIGLLLWEEAYESLYEWRMDRKRHRNKKKALEKDPTLSLDFEAHLARARELFHRKDEAVGNVELLAFLETEIKAEELKRKALDKRLKSAGINIYDILPRLERPNSLAGRADQLLLGKPLDLPKQLQTKA
jgi:hypothetical protein